MVAEIIFATFGFVVTVTFAGVILYMIGCIIVNFIRDELRK